MTMGLLVLGVVAVGFVATGAAVAVVGAVMLRRNARLPTSRVPVEAVVVHRTSHVRPSSVTFDYPVPGGWLRARRVEGLPVTNGQGRVAQPGDRITVWVDPRDPAAVRLSSGASASSMGGVLLILMGLLLVGGGLWFATVSLVVGR